MSIIGLIIVIAIVVICFWANYRYVTGIWRTVFNVILVVILVGIILSLLGWLPNLKANV